MRIVILDSFAADQGDADACGTGCARWASWSSTRAAPTPTSSRAAPARRAVLTNKVPFSAATLRGAARAALRRRAGDRHQHRRPRGRARGGRRGHQRARATRPASVAELVFALILHFSHDVAGHAAAVKAGAWAASPDFCFFTRPLFELGGQDAGRWSAAARSAAPSPASARRSACASCAPPCRDRRRAPGAAHAARRGAARRRRRVAALPAHRGDARHGRRALPRAR